MTGNGGGIQQNTTVTLTVMAPPNFTISASPASLNIAARQSRNLDHHHHHQRWLQQLHQSLGFRRALGHHRELSTRSTIPAPGVGNSTMTITVGSSTPTGTYPITVTGNGGGIQQNTTVTLTVTAPPNFTISASPASLSVAQGNQGTSTITTTISGGFNSAITLSASGMPSGTTVTFNPQTIPAPGAGSSTMTITVGSSTPPELIPSP